MLSLSRRAALVALAAGLALAPAASLGAATKIKAIDGSSGWEFTPDKKTVVKGTTVKWLGKSMMVHHVAFYKKPAKSGVGGFNLEPGGAVKRKMKKPGVYKYRCTLSNHSSLSGGTCTGMCGQVKVTKS